LGRSVLRPYSKRNSWYSWYSWFLPGLYQQNPHVRGTPQVQHTPPPASTGTQIFFAKRNMFLSFNFVETYEKKTAEMIFALRA
jgi:hypothetical protein